MDKSLLVYLLIGIGFLYMSIWLIDGSMYRANYSDNKSVVEYKTYESKDSVGQIVLRVSGLEENKQIDIWNASTVREEWLEFFPDFAEMKLFIEDRVEGAYIKKRLGILIDTVEGSYLSGHITIDTAKQMLGVLK